MAADAGRCAMLAEQVVFGVPVMIKRAGLPLFDAVTGLTFLAKLTFVALAAVIVFLVAAHAGARRVLVLATFVAISAFGINVLAFQIESRA